MFIILFKNKHSLNYLQMNDFELELSSKNTDYDISEIKRLNMEDFSQMEWDFEHSHK